MDSFRMSSNRFANADAISASMMSLMSIVTSRMAAVGVLGMLVVSIISTVDVIILRYLLSDPIPGTNELYSTVLAVAITAVLSSGIIQDGNLEVDLLSHRLRPGLVAGLRAIGSIVQLFTIVYVLIASTRYAMDVQSSALETTVLRLPMAPFIWAVVAFLAVCVPSQFAISLRTVSAFAGGERCGPKRFAMVYLAGALLVAAIFLMGYLLLTWLQPVLSANTISVAVLSMGLLWVLILGFLPLSAAMIICGILVTASILDLHRAFSVVASETVGLITSSDLAVIPLFLLMGGLATAGGFAADIYRMGNALFGWARGGLAMATIAGSAGFDAFTGSSLATVVTMGKAGLPEMEKRGYSVPLSLGSIAAGGTLGQLVPPSTVVVLYALLTESSIGALYIAVLVPALITTIFYILTIRLSIWLRPELAPPGEPFHLGELLASMKAAAAVVVMFVLMLGGVYTGIFTVTEAAAVGVVISFFVALLRGKLGRGAFWKIAAETTKSTAMIYLIMIGAKILSFGVGISGLSEGITQAIAAMQVAPVVIILMLVVVYIALGTMLDSFAVMLITASISAGVVQSLGYDLLWWGVMMVALVEIGVITPPFGLNLFAIKTLSPEAKLSDVYRGVIPFVVADLVKIGLFILFPAIILFLPHLAAR